jgi:hypothetical protein
VTASSPGRVPASEPRLYPDVRREVPRTGAIGSLQGAELCLYRPASEILDEDFLNRAAREYWRLITRFTLGLIRVITDADGQSVVLVARPLVLLRFSSPELELSSDRGSVTWPIERGILVSRAGRDRGFLRLSVSRINQSDSDRGTPVRVQMEVRNFYPWLRGSGAFASVGVWIYAQTQQRIHRFVTRAFLRRLPRTALAAEATGRSRSPRRDRRPSPRRPPSRRPPG